MKKTLTNPDSVAKPVGLYSHLATVEVGSAIFLFVAGQVAVDSEGKLVGQNDFLKQAEQVHENIKAILKAGGATLDDVIKLTTFLTDMSHRAELGAVRRRYFTGTPPTSTAVEVSKLAHPDWMIEIEAVAVIEKK